MTPLYRDFFEFNWQPYMTFLHLVEMFLPSSLTITVHIQLQVTLEVYPKVHISNCNSEESLAGTNCNDSTSIR